MRLNCIFLCFEALVVFTGRRAERERKGKRSKCFRLGVEPKTAVVRRILQQTLLVWIKRKTHQINMCSHVHC